MYHVIFISNQNILNFKWQIFAVDCFCTR